MYSDILIQKLRRLVRLTAADEQAVRSLGCNVSYIPRHRDILRQEKEPKFLYLVVSGWAARFGLRADGSRRITAFLLPGDFCGIHAVAGATMDHAILALTDCEIAAIPVAEVEEVIAVAPVLMKALWRSKLADEALLRQWLLASGDALRAVARMLCELHARASAAGLCVDDVCDMPVTQEQLGDAVGMTGVHVNRTLRRLRESGYARVDVGKLTVFNLEGLKSIGQWDDRSLKPWLD